MKRRIVLGAGLVAFILAGLLTRTIWDGRRALARGDAALAKGDPEGAIAEWRRAARWYAPGAPHVAVAYDRLERFAQDAEAQGQRELALEAWRGIRSSALATRSFYIPFSDRLERANQRIAVIMAEQEGGAPERKAFHLGLLERDEAPSVAWSTLAILGFAAWVGGGFWFAWRGVSADDRLDKKNAARSALLVAAGLLVWMLGLYKA